MKMRITIAICFILSLSLLSAYDIYGAFRIKTSPRGADVNLYDIDEYLSDTPTDVFPVFMDEFMEFREGIPGREIVLMITKRGYQPFKKRIFVPFRYTDLDDAMDDPSVFYFDLSRDRRREYYDVCYYYSIRTVRVRPVYIYWTPSPRPWYPYGFVYYNNPQYNHPYNPPYNPPYIPGGGQGGGQGGFHDGGVISPPGGGGHGGGHGGGNGGGGGGHGNGVVTPPVVPPTGGNYKLDTNSNANGQNLDSRPPAKSTNPTIDKDKRDTTPTSPGRNSWGSSSTVEVEKPQTPQKEDSPKVSKPSENKDIKSKTGKVKAPSSKEKTKNEYVAPKPSKQTENKTETENKTYKSDDRTNKTNDTPTKDKDDEKTKSTKTKRK